jgi:hypothetical protein
MTRFASLWLLPLLAAGIGIPVETAAGDLFADLRVAGQSDKNVTITHIGQVVPMDLYIRVTGENDDYTDDALWKFYSSFESTNVNRGSVLGSMRVTATLPFCGMCYQDSRTGGVYNQDLDGDGDLDLGSADQGDASGWFLARAPYFVSAEGNGPAEFHVATLSFTVTQFLSPGEDAATDINALPRLTGDSIWLEDGQPKARFLSRADGMPSGEGDPLKSGAPVSLVLSPELRATLPPLPPEPEPLPEPEPTQQPGTEPEPLPQLPEPAEPPEPQPPSTAEPVQEPGSEPPSVPQPDPATTPAAEPVEQPAEPVAEPPSVPQPDPATTPVAEPVEQPAEPVAEPVAPAEPEPAVTPSTPEPEASQPPAAQPEPAEEPATTTAPDPEPTQQPAAEPGPADTWSDDASGGQTASAGGSETTPAADPAEDSTSGGTSAGGAASDDGTDGGASTADSGGTGAAEGGSASSGDDDDPPWSPEDVPVFTTGDGLEFGQTQPVDFYPVPDVLSAGDLEAGGTCGGSGVASSGDWGLDAAYNRSDSSGTGDELRAPEPATLGLLALGLAAMLVRRKRP